MSRPKRVVEKKVNLNVRGKRTSIMREIRNKTGLSQTAFSELFCISLDTLKHWECEKRTPPFCLMVCLDLCAEMYVEGTLTKESIDECAKKIDIALSEEREG